MEIESCKIKRAEIQLKVKSELLFSNMSLVKDTH